MVKKLSNQFDWWWLMFRLLCEFLFLWWINDSRISDIPTVTCLLWLCWFSWLVTCLVCFQLRRRQQHKDLQLTTTPDGLVGCWLAWQLCRFMRFAVAIPQLCVWVFVVIVQSLLQSQECCERYCWSHFFGCFRFVHCCEPASGNITH